MAQSKPEILELLKSKIKVEDDDSKDGLDKHEISKLLNDSDNSDQIDIGNIDLQVFKPKKKHPMYSSSYDFENGDYLYQNEGSVVGADSKRRRHVSEGGIDMKMKAGGTLHSSHSSSLDMLPRIEEVGFAFL